MIGREMLPCFCWYTKCYTYLENEKKKRSERNIYNYPARPVFALICSGVKHLKSIEFQENATVPIMVIKKSVC